MTPLLRWGLPDRTRDTLLFGGDAPWTADQFAARQSAAQLTSRNAAADTDLNPITDRTALIDLTADPAARAEILRRYRLYSRQPDEMIILRALQRMQPRRGDFDPRLYQYGGAYIYTVAAAVAAGAATGLLHVTSDIGYYLERPAAFARFYLAARCVSLVFGAFTLLAAFRLAEQLAGRRAGWLALFCVALLPVFITAVLEAKPHLPSACMVLWATYSALRYRAIRQRGLALRMGAQAGLAFGLVLTGLLSLALWPALILSTARGQRTRVAVHLAWAALVFAGVYAATNPYVLWNALFHPELLRSNLSNSTAMYAGQMARLLTSGAAHTAFLLLLGAGPLLLLLGLVGLVQFARRTSYATLILSAVPLAFLAMGALLLAGKPAEHARFLILPALVIAIFAAAHVAMLFASRRVLGTLAAALLLTTTGAPLYWRSFARDAAGHDDTRRRAGEFLATTSPAQRIGVVQEPAPYAIPPLDFAHRAVVLLPTRRPAEPHELPEWLVLSADREPRRDQHWWGAEYELVVRFPASGWWLSPVAWADKPTFIYRRVAEPPKEAGDATREELRRPPGRDDSRMAT